MVECLNLRRCVKGIKLSIRFISFGRLGALLRHHHHHELILEHLHGYLENGPLVGILLRRRNLRSHLDHSWQWSLFRAKISRNFWGTAKKSQNLIRECTHWKHRTGLTNFSIHRIDMIRKWFKIREMGVVNFFLGHLPWWFGLNRAVISGHRPYRLVWNHIQVQIQTSYEKLIREDHDQTTEYYTTHHDHQSHQAADGHLEHNQYHLSLSQDVSYFFPR